MALKRGPTPDAVSLTACPFCETAIPERESFADHWRRDCPDNPGRGAV